MKFIIEFVVDFIVILLLFIFARDYDLNKCIEEGVLQIDNKQVFCQVIDK